MAKINGVGILGYGGYIPRYRIRCADIARAWGKDGEELPVEEKTVARYDEDALTMAVEASRYAIKRARINPKKIGAVHVGTESKPYAVKPTGTILAEAIGASQDVVSADFEFACKAGTEALQSVIAMVESNMIEYGLAVGSDTAQARPGDVLEYTASSGAAAFVIGKDGGEMVALFEASSSFVTDTPDFWRRDAKAFPVHTHRFTGAPAYFKHTVSATLEVIEQNGYTVRDFDYVVFHQPNVKFPLESAKILGIPLDKVKPSLVAGLIGNTYAACSLLGLVNVLDIARPGQKILLTSFGSGAGSDSFVLTVTDRIEEKKVLAPSLSSLIYRKKYVDYATYARSRKLLKGQA